MTTQTIQDLSSSRPAQARSRPTLDTLALVEWGLALTITALAIAAHVIVLFDAGHLWRDEAVSIGLATLPTVGGIWRDLQTDSFPLLWPLLLRLWAAIVGAGNDQGLRVLGSFIGLGFLGVLWLHARQTVARVPLLGLAFCGLHAAVVCYGDSIRGYGLGILTGALTVAMLWRALEKDTVGAWLLALAAALVSVHSVFHNAPFLLASCSATATVLLLRKQWKKVAIPLGIGAISAISMLPYGLTLASSKQWVPIFQYSMSFPWLWSKLNEAFAQTGSATFVIWLVAVISGAALTSVLFLPTLRAKLSLQHRELLAFSGVTLIAGILSHMAFLWVLSYYMNPWYFLTTLAIVGISLDGIASAFPGKWPRLLRLGIANLAVIFATVPVLGAAQEMRTDIDLVAANIQKMAGPGDFIVVGKWWVGYSFQREYSGKAPWTTIPPLPFPHNPAEINHMGLKRQMQNPNQTMDSVLRTVRQSLKNGDRVWFVGDIIIPRSVKPVGRAPAYGSSRASPFWTEGAYENFWVAQLGEVLRDHANTPLRLDINATSPVSSYENEPLYVVSGWHD